MNEPVINPNGRGVSTQSTSSLKDLVFNPETGDFEQVDRGTANEGDTVTKMTEDGFALTLSDGFSSIESSERKANKDSFINSNGSFINSNSYLRDLVFNLKTNEFELIDRIPFRDEETIYPDTEDHFC